MFTVKACVLAGTLQCVHCESVCTCWNSVFTVKACVLAGTVSLGIQCTVL